MSIFAEEGKANREMNVLLDKLPRDKTPVAGSLGKISMNPDDLIPLYMPHYYYKGSLTSPPCDEDVSWHVLNTSIEMSSGQISRIQNYRSGTNRPIQETNGRSVINLL